MDKAYKILKNQSKIVNIFLMFCVGFSSIITLERPDYNLFLFLFVAFSMFWEQGQSKQNPKIIIFERMLFTFTMTLSLFVDLIWILTHNGINSSFIIFFSWIEFFIKICVILIVFIMWKGYSKQCSTEDIEGTGFNNLEEEEP